jgi:hypothetical protein
MATLSTASLIKLQHLLGDGNANEVATLLNLLQNISTAEIATIDAVTAGTASASKALVLGAAKNIDTIAQANAVIGTDTTPGAAIQQYGLIGKKTGIADATATSILTVTCPNTTQTAVLKVTLIAAVNNAGALDSARVGTGIVVFDRVAGAALVGTAATLGNAAIATSGTATLTLAYALAAVAGAVGAVNTMDLQVTLTKTGGTNHQCMFIAEFLNSEAAGMTIAAA